MECDTTRWNDDIKEIEEQEEEHVVSENAKRLSLSLPTVSCLHLSKCPQLAQARA